MELNLLNFSSRFPDEQACYAYITKQRWPDGVACIKCGSIKTYACKTRKLFKCGDCSKQFSPLVGTIFQGTHLPLRAWFMAVYRLTTDGVSTNELKDELGITQKSAWFLTQRILEAMNNHNIVLSGLVQVDETYFGPKARGRSSARFSKKYAVIGAAEAKPDGKVVMEVVKQPDATVAMSFIRRNIAPGSVIHTDESRIYGALKYEYQHATVNHSQHQYVDGGVTSNLIENNWAHAKRLVKGHRIWVSGKHLSSYMQGEHQFKRNMRNHGAGERFTQWLSQAWGVRLTYKQLLAKRAVEPLALRGRARRRAMLPVQMSLF